MQSVIYYSPAKRVIPFFLGSGGGIKVFFNNMLIYRFSKSKDVATPDQDDIVHPREKGIGTHLLLKVEDRSERFYLLCKDHR